jgi:glycosyltransferase involved in cell wall biosynthesis
MRASQKRVLVYSAQMESVGGIESHVIEFCLRVAGAGYEITLLCSRYELHAEGTQRLHDSGVELIVNQARWSSSSPLRKWLWTLLALLGLGWRRFDAVYTNGQGRNPATVHRWFRGRTRLVHHHHTSCDPQDVASWPPAYVEAMQRADALVVCADFIRARMQRAIERSDVSVVYCFSRAPQAPELTPTRADDQLTFGYFGRLIREKGIDWILRLSADPRLQGITWKLWGNEGAYCAADFVGRANVEYCGAFADERGLAAALSTLHCYCLFSSHPEGVPISLIEVMGAGRPWIATTQGGIPELAHDPEACVLVTLQDYEPIVEACRLMAARIRARHVSAERQRAFYRARFSEEALLPQWLALLGA